jgi:serine/threonine protein kinase
MINPPVVLQRVIGKGSHGIVYQGRYAHREKLVAVKKVRDTPSSRHELDALQILQEAPHIVQYIDACKDRDGDLLLIMELCAGVSAQELVERVRGGEDRMTERELRRFAQGMVMALLHCHEREYLFGDVKPQNVMVSADGEATMIDLGCVRNGLAFERPLGTPLFFAPEKFQHTFGLKSDVWSLGVVLYMLVAGHHPYVHMPHYEKNMRAGMADLQAEIEATPLTFHHPHWDDMSKELQDLLRKMLEKDAHQRTSIEYAATHSWWSKSLC